MYRRQLLTLAGWPLLGLPGCGGVPGTEPPTPAITTIGRLAVAHHTVVAAGDAGLVVIGGDRGLSTLSDAVDRLDPASGRLARIATLASGRASHTAVALNDGRILVAGGAIALAGAPASELIDPASGTVEDAGALVLPRREHAMTLLGDGRVLVTGGTGRDTAELWDPGTRRWRLLPGRMQHARAGHSATRLADGRVLIVGGDAGGLAGYRFAELWDPGSEAFAPLAADGAEPRMLHAAWRSPEGDVHIVGGERPSLPSIVPLASAWRFDAAASRFVVARGLAQPRTLAAAVAGDDGTLLLIGGQTNDAPASPRLGAWTPSDGEQVLPDLPGARRWHTATRAPDGAIVVVGGEDAQQRFVPAVLRIG